MLTEKTLILNRWKDYCESLFTDYIGNSQNECPEPEILRSEVETALRKTKLQKSAVVDRIVGEMLKT